MSTTPIPSPSFTDEKNKWWNRVFLPGIIVFSSFIFFWLLQFLVRWYLFGKWTFPTFSYFKIRRFRRSRRSTKDMDSKSMQLVPPNKKWRISNEIVSLFHSAISGLGALFLLASFDEITNLVDYKKDSAYYLVYLTFGYLVHDFIDLVVNERSARIIELLFHHIVVISAFMVTLVTELFLYIVVFGLLMEVNSVFLHTRSLMNLYRVSKESTSFKIVSVLNLATFVLFRLSVSLALVAWLLYHYAAGQVVWYLQIINSLVLLSLFITNVVLFYRVLAADGLLGDARARPSGNARQGTIQNQGDDDNDEQPIDDEEDEGADEEDVEASQPMQTHPQQNNHHEQHAIEVNNAVVNNAAQIQPTSHQNDVFVVNITEH